MSQELGGGTPGQPMTPLAESLRPDSQPDPQQQVGRELADVPLHDPADVGLGCARMACQCSLGDLGLPVLSTGFLPMVRTLISATRQILAKLPRPHPSRPVLQVLFRVVHVDGQLGIDPQHGRRAKCQTQHDRQLRRNGGSPVDDPVDGLDVDPQVIRQPLLGDVHRPQKVIPQDFPRTSWFSGSFQVHRVSLSRFSSDSRQYYIPVLGIESDSSPSPDEMATP